MSKIKIVGKMEVEESFYGQLVLGKGVSSSLDEKLISEARKAGILLLWLLLLLILIKGQNVI